MEANGQDVMRERIKAYRDSIKEGKPELDVALLMRILDMVNESSEVHIAVDPVDAEGGWVSDAPKYAVAGLRKLDDGRLALRVADENHGIAASKLYDQYQKELKRESGKGMPVLFARKGEVVRLTDAYSHSLVRKMWAGMPFDVVLAVRG